MMIGVGTFKTSPNMRRYVLDVLDRERLSYGPYTQAFEKKFAAMHDCKYAIMTNSGTSSLQAAITVLKDNFGWKDGDEVLVPAVTFVATSNVVIQNNLIPVYVDIEKKYYGIDPMKIEEKIGPRTRAVIPVHLFGLPCAMDPILEVAKKYNLKIIEDSCETMFAKYKDRSVGSFGDISCFSTYVAHIISTGVGGLCTTNDAELARDIKSVVNHGRDAIYISIDDDKDKSSAELSLIMKKRFSFVRNGYSYRATELQGALGLAELENSQQNIAQRRRNGSQLSALLADLCDKVQLPAIREYTEHSFMMFPMVLHDEKKHGMCEYLEAHGIETREMLPLINQPIVRKFVSNPQDEYPVATWVNDNGFYLGCHHGLAENEMNYISDIIHGYFQNKSHAIQKLSLVILCKYKYGIEKLTFQNFLGSIPFDDFDEVIIIDSSAEQMDPTLLVGFPVKYLRGVLNDLGRDLYLAVENAKFENIILMGGNGSDSAASLQEIKLRLIQGKELVIASRFHENGKRINQNGISLNSMGNRFLTFILNLVQDSNLTDANNIFRGFKKSAIKKILQKPIGNFTSFEISFWATQSGVEIAEVPTVEKQPLIFAGKKSNFGNALKMILVSSKLLYLKMVAGWKNKD